MYASGYVLQDVNLRVEPGQLVGIVGPVGSSKSTLLMALLREIAPIGESYESYDVSGDEVRFARRYEPGEAVLGVSW